MIDAYADLIVWRSFPYSQTFENKSSLPPNPLPPPAGLLCCDGGGLAAAGAAGAALLQPPKSSSGATLGAACEVLPNVFVKVDGWVFEEAEVPPHAEKSVDMGIEGAFGGAASFG